MNSKERNVYGQRLSLITLIINFLLSLGKIFAGIVGHSGAMIADGFHSMSDMISTIGVMIGLHVSSKPKDKNHQYGHERFESLIAKLIADILLLTAVAIAYKALKVMITKDYSSPGMIAIYAAIISIIIKE